MTALGGDVSFGLGMISGQHDPADPRTDTELYADILDLCGTAETLGFDAVWLSEHHFVDDGYMPSLLPAAAAIAARTSRIAIGTGVLVAPLHDPLRLAEDAATVDLLSAGRLVLGLGAGYREEEFAGFGRRREGLGTALDGIVATLRAAWSGDPVCHGSGTTPVVVTPRPHQPGGPPIWLGARTPAGTRRTARAADGLLAARVSPAELGDQVQRLDTEAAGHGRKPAELAVAVHCPVFAWPSAGAAWRRVEPHLHYSEWKYADMVREPYGARTARAQQPALSDSARRKIRAGALVGTPGDVAGSIAAYAAAASGHPFHFIARLYWPGMDPALMREALAVYADQVIPEVVSRRPGRRVRDQRPQDVGEPDPPRRAVLATAHVPRSQNVPNETIELGVDGAVATITLNRPDVVNAISPRMRDELEDALAELRPGDRVRVVRIRGAGRGFCSGYDLASGSSVYNAGLLAGDATRPAPGEAALAELGESSLVLDRERLRDGIERWLRMWDYRKPIVAQVHGACLSGGLDLIGVCDLVYAAKSARFGHPAARGLGIPPTMGMLPAKIGAARTKELFFTGDTIDGHEAFRLGLVNAVVPDTELDERTAALCRRIAQTPLDALTLHKHIINRWSEIAGLRLGALEGADFDAMFHATPASAEFGRIAAQDGVPAALSWRDAAFDEH